MNKNLSLYTQKHRHRCSSTKKNFKLNNFYVNGERKLSEWAVYVTQVPNDDGAICFALTLLLHQNHCLSCIIGYSSTNEETTDYIRI